MLRGVRGATTVTENQASLIQSAVSELIQELLTRNHIQVDRIIGVFFTVTPDLDALNPAKAIRNARSDWASVPMLCMPEAPMAETLPHCIRVLIQWDAAGDSNGPIPVYLSTAKQLRPDHS